MLGGDFVCFHGHSLYGIRTDRSMRKTDFSRRFFSDNPIAMEESMKYERFFFCPDLYGNRIFSWTGLYDSRTTSLNDGPQRQAATDPGHTDLKARRQRGKARDGRGQDETAKAVFK